VKLLLKRAINKGIIGVFLLLTLLIGCISTRPTIQIPDYIIVPNGKEVVGKKNLTAFIFENNLKKPMIEKFLSEKFKTSNYLEKEFWITIDKNKYKIIIYDSAEFEKYFNSANYSAINQEPESEKTGDQRKFIAISMINSYNEDCLADSSLFQNVAIKYLKNLKDEYYNH
jgi:hydroxymethylpyrimidine pyrophosphatase-like HAD family hydrolase